MNTTRRLANIGAAVLIMAGCTQQAVRHPLAHRATPSTPSRMSTPSRAVSDALVRQRIVLGYSRQHRPIVAIQIGDPDSRRRVLIVGCIHGNEPAGIAITGALASARIPPELDLWLVPDLNPDGVSARTRVNARGVDLNRNFPYLWRPLGPAGSLHYAGPHAASEPETHLAVRLLRTVRPTLGIWYHQALDVVDSSQGPFQLERRYAADAGLPLRSLPDSPGSAVGYEDHVFGPTAFVVELPAGPVTGPMLTRHVRAVLDLAMHARPVHA